MSRSKSKSGAGGKEAGGRSANLYRIHGFFGEGALERRAVRSTNIVSVGYDGRAKVLEIEFHSGGVYQYAGVPEKRYRDMMKASAIGSYFHREIKPWYVCRKIG